MNKNIFIKKYNPDVNEKFNKCNNKINIDINYKKEVWKGITGNDFNVNVQNSKDFIIQFEKPDFNKIILEHDNQYNTRQKEIDQIEKKNKLIKEAALENVMKIETELGIIPSTQNIKSHDELKQIQINENDILKEEKQEFNNLLKNLESII